MSFRIQKINPQVKDTKNLKHDLNLLIKSKENLFPNETRKIASARILDAGDEFKIIAAFFD